MAGGRRDVGQYMLMLFTREGEQLLRCWLCPAALSSRSDYLGHLLQRPPRTMPPLRPGSQREVRSQLLGPFPAKR